MDTTTIVPGIEAGQVVLGLSLKEIARAVLADESTLHRWKGGSMPTPVFLSRLEVLAELAREIGQTFRDPSTVAHWLQTPIPALGNTSPREAILAGRAETVLGMLVGLNAGFSL